MKGRERVRFSYWLHKGLKILAMAAVTSLSDIQVLIRLKVEKERWTHLQLKDYILLNFPNIRGASLRSIERFCSVHDIHKTSRPDDVQLQLAVREAIEKVCWFSFSVRS